MTMIFYDRHRGGRMFDVDLAAPARERWKPIAQELADELHEFLGDIVALVEEQLDTFPAWLRPMLRNLISACGHVVHGVAKLFRETEYADEIAGIARAAGLPRSHLFLANLMYDIVAASERYRTQWGHVKRTVAGTGHRIASLFRRKPHACSSFSCTLPSGKPVIGRNMDWCWPDTVGKHTIVVRMHKGNQHYLNITALGCVGVTSAMLPGKWAVTLNQAPCERLPVNKLQWPSLQRLRHVCDQFGSFRSLVGRLQEYWTMTPFFVHVVGTKPKEQMIVQGFGKEFSVRRGHGDPQIQTNHFVNDDDAALNSKDEWTDDEGTTWICDSRPRYQARA